MAKTQRDMVVTAVARGAGRVVRFEGDARDVNWGVSSLDVAAAQVARSGERVMATVRARIKTLPTE